MQDIDPNDMRNFNSKTSSDSISRVISTNQSHTSLNDLGGKFEIKSI
jgi:hypothetical protein